MALYVRTGIPGASRKNLKPGRGGLPSVGLLLTIAFGRSSGTLKNARPPHTE